MRDFTRLTIWQRSRALAAELVALDIRRSRHRAPGLLSQIRRAALSIPANIAEGCGHDSPQEFIRFLSIAIGSAMELESHLLLARETGLIHPARAEALLKETVAVRRMSDRLRGMVRGGGTGHGSPPLSGGRRGAPAAAQGTASQGQLDPAPSAPRTIAARQAHTAPRDAPAGPPLSDAAEGGAAEPPSASLTPPPARTTTPTPPRDRAGS